MRHLIASFALALLAACAAPASDDLDAAPELDASGDAAADAALWQPDAAPDPALYGALGRWVLDVDLGDCIDAEVQRFELRLEVRPMSVVGQLAVVTAGRQAGEAIAPMTAAGAEIYLAGAAVVVVDGSATWSITLRDGGELARAVVTWDGDGDAGRCQTFGEALVVERERLP